MNDRQARTVAITVSFALSLFTLSLCGCLGQEETIRRYVIPKEKTRVATGGTEQSPSERLQGPATSRMLAAIVPGADKAWFFKLVGPVDEVEASAGSFQSFIESLRFPDDSSGNPKWQLPEQWTEQPGSGMRFATVKVPGKEKPMELTVIPLPMSGGREQYLVSNINRWRADQLQLPPIRAEDLANVTTEVKLPNATATLIDFKGHFRSGGMSNAPFARRSAPPGHPPILSNTKLNFEAPSEWTAGTLTATRGGVTLRYEATFSVQREDQNVEITVSRFPAANPLANVNRWRDQIGLPRLSASQLEQEKQQIPVGDGQGDYYQLISQDAEDKSQAILAVIAQRPSGAWFFKLIGDRELVLQEKGRFEAFMASVSFTKTES